MKLSQSNINESNLGRQPAFQYHARPMNRTLVNLYYRHAKPGFTGKQVTSIRRAAFQVSVRVPQFTANAMNYTRPATYY